LYRSAVAELPGTRADHIEYLRNTDMENPLINSVKGAVKYWYLPLIFGILFIIVGIWVSITPMASFVTLSYIFAFTFLFAGILEVIYAISNRRAIHHWGWSLAGGILGLIIGFLLVSNPGISMVALPLYIGFAIVIYAIAGIGRSVALKRHQARSWGYSMFTSILGVIFGLLMMFNPVFGGLTIVFYTALSFLIVGAINIFLAIRMRKIDKKLDNEL
jgi:uncharacterized membrane protein HdeD (DUF308 family)